MWTVSLYIRKSSWILFTPRSRDEIMSDFYQLKWWVVCTHVRGSGISSIRNARVSFEFHLAQVPVMAPTATPGTQAGAHGSSCHVHCLRANPFPDSSKIISVNQNAVVSSQTRYDPSLLPLLEGKNTQQ